MRRVHVVAPDVITGKAVAALLDGQFTLACTPPADVALVVDDVFLPSTMGRVQDTAALGVPIVLLTHQLQAGSLLTLIGHGVGAVLDSASTSRAQLVEAIDAAARGAGIVSPELMGPLLRQVRDLQRTILHPLGYTGVGLSTREVEILRLLAEGRETKEIADALSYSESTVKKDLHELITRFRLRNRTQAVAFAIRAGVL
ncbi:response regulator transcription factor [Kutzneria sp. 744]|uniref:helix-turn-helix transcriptional regulator n=1 Tax=Kutzneria sp. (strain 744) TaxID=345341 RepID=UPI0003EEC093|nr:response regulator transcription factor [Kutzneria sp. 744]EWM17176.1 DNA-binding response regulator [Kutzneria sp. 744]